MHRVCLSVCPCRRLYADVCVSVAALKAVLSDPRVEAAILQDAEKRGYTFLFFLVTLHSLKLTTIICLC